MISQERRQLLRSFLLGASLTVLVAALQASGMLDRMENFFYDQRCRYCQPAVQPTDKLVQLDVDDESVAAIGRWPWPRPVLASIIDALHDAGARAIGLDVLLAD